jgi:hypothetical protein
MISSHNLVPSGKVKAITVLFRSIRPSRVTKGVAMAEIGCLSHVTPSVAMLKMWQKIRQIFLGPAGRYKCNFRDVKIIFWPEFLARHSSQASWTN